jgi:hypothetical protein
MVASTSLKYAQTEEGYVFQLAGVTDHLLLLIRHSGELDTVPLESQTFKTSFKPIAGLLGVIHLYSNYYVVIAETASNHGSIYDDKIIYKVESTNVLSLNLRHKPDEDEIKYTEMLKNHLDTATLFFSYNYDLTRTFGNQKHNDPLGFNNEFMWNYFISSSLIDLSLNNPNVSKFVLPVIYGYSKFVKTTINSKHITFGLITRRSRLRAGTRYFRRGIDNNGDVANFNETEQFLVVHSKENGNDEDQVFTYLQIRGSVPVYWAEMNNLQYKPKLLLGPSDYLPARIHFDKCISKYGTNYLVNLVNQSGYERPVKLAYENAVTALNDSNLKYTYFDFHHECSKMRWDRVKLLLQHLVELGLSQNDYSHYTIGKTFVAEKTQTHAVRTNCMDCLDRTNVVQSMLGRWFLQQQLTDCKIIDGFTDWQILDPSFNLVFQNIWADNADYVSNAYSGTGALKTDYTRTGKRTKKGAINDLINSITRYIKNNYLDGTRQDGFDLFLGNALPYEMTTSPFKDLRPSFYQAIPYMFTVGIFIVFATLIWPKGSITDFKNVSFLSVMTMLSGFSLWFMVKNGIQFVDWPVLEKLDFLRRKEIYKNGKVEGYLFDKEEGFNKFTGYDKKQ